ncbi:MAG: hypothetical protein LW832_01225 [Parachlamydia sp.]|jgi:exopolyphosphatase|nr:hypothetical protein [Parachlamydia sp.]
MNYSATISEYLKKVYETFIHRSYSSNELIYLVMGNESADMDSIVSALTYSYANHKNDLWIPLINIFQSELYLRKHVMHTFKTLNIDPNRILYKEHMAALESLSLKRRLRVVMVDHNKLYHFPKIKP